MCLLVDKLKDEGSERTDRSDKLEQRERTEKSYCQVSYEGIERGHATLDQQFVS